MDKINIRGIYHEVGKSFKYVHIYDQIFHKIMSGELKRGEKLPSENILSKQFNTSRVTIRQSLSLLIEDGFINVSQGKGYFINNLLPGIDDCAFTKKMNPIYNSIKSCVSDIETRFNIEAPSDFIIKTTNNSELTIISDRWYRDKDGKIIAYSLSFTPINIIEKFNIDINVIENFTNFLEIDIYKYNTKSNYIINHSKNGNFVSNRYVISENNDFLILIETIYYNEYVLTYSKHYIPLEEFKINLTL